MKHYFTLLLTIILSSIITLTFAQNEYQIQLYELTGRLNVLEKTYATTGLYSKVFLENKLDLTKDFHRLGEAAGEAVINQDLDKELGDLILTTSELAVLRLTFLEYYLHYKKEMYKVNYDKSKAIFLSLFLRVKALEK